MYVPHTGLAESRAMYPSGFSGQQTTVEGAFFYALKDGLHECHLRATALLFMYPFLIIR